MSNLPGYLVYRKTSKHGEMVVRKINHDKEAGIRISEELYDFPGESHAEIFINREDAKNIIFALRDYFQIED